MSRWIAVTLLLCVALDAVAAPPPLTGMWGSCDDASPTTFSPVGVAVGPDGSVYVADEPRGRILRFDAAGAVLGGWGAPGSGPGQFEHPQGIAVAWDGEVYVSDTFNHRIQRFDASGAFLGSWGTLGSGEGQFQSPRGIVVLPDHHLIVGDGDGRLQEFTADGSFIRSWRLDPLDLSYHFIYGIARSASGDLYMSTQPSTVFHHSAAGILQERWDLSAEGPGRVSQPFGIACTSSGHVVVGDFDITLSHIVEFTGNGAFVQSWGGAGSDPGQFLRVMGLAIGSGGDLYAGDPGNCRVQRFGAGPVPAKRTSWGQLKKHYR